MSIVKGHYSKTIGFGGGGKCRVYYSEKYKRKVVEKRVDDNFLQAKDTTPTRTKTLITEKSNKEF